MFVCPFPTNPKFWKTWDAFFFYLFNFSFLNKIVKINFSKCIATVPKVNCVGTEGICAYLHVSTRLLAVTYLDTENYMIYIAFLKKQKRKTDRPKSPSQFSGQKGKQTFYFFRPIQYHCD